MRNPDRGFFIVGIAAVVCAMALSSPAGLAAGDSGNRPADASMTCQQIAVELQPYMQRMSPSVTALGQTAQAVRKRGEERNKQAAAESAAETAEARATMLDPTGLTGKIVAEQQRKRQEALRKRVEAEDKPLFDKGQAQAQQVVKQAQPLQSDARLQRLMQLAQEKNCR
jgi:hypothetical protein